MTHYLDKVVDILWYQMASTMMENEEKTFHIMENIVPGRFDSSSALKASLQRELRKLDREQFEGKNRDEIVTKED